MSLFDPHIANILLRDPAFAEVSESLNRNPEQAVNYFGLDDRAKVLAALALAGGKSLLYVVPDPLRLRSLRSDLNALSDEPAAVFRAQAADYLARGVGSRENEIERLSLLTAWLEGRIPVLLTTASALLESLPRVEELKGRILRLTTGLNMKREELLEQIALLGYERCGQIETAGQFSVRGELIDLGVRLTSRVYGIEGDCCGIRLSFFDTELESIRLFDPLNQRSVDQLEQVSLPPVRELLIREEERAGKAKAIREARNEAIRDLLRSGGSKEEGAAIRKWSDEDAEAIEHGLDRAGLKRWEWLLREQAGHLTDYAAETGSLMVLDEPDLLRARMDAAEAEQQQEMKALILSGKLLAKAAENRYTPADVFRSIDRVRPILSLSQIASGGNGLPGGKNAQSAVSPADQYHGRERFLFDDLKKWRREKWSIVLCASGEKRRSRLREVLNEESVTLPVNDLALSEGFIWRAAGLAVLGNVNLFGSERKSEAKRKNRGGDPILFFGDLEPGEYVVHETHGIGRYSGLKTLITDGVKRDYLHIRYAEDDQLYIPVDHLDEIRKYVAGDGKIPRLSRLGSGDWEKKKSRARDSIRKLATNLLEVYAKRSQENGHAFSADSVWQEQFEDAFPYEETADQQKASAEIKKDMESPRVMDRLLCGDVGFGKTEIAFRALFKAVMDGYQGAMLVPTTVLAQQHYDSLRERLGELPVQVRLLSRFTSAERSREIRQELKTGSADIVIGTHRVLSRDIQFSKLGLLVIDEEQRFGVDHKESLKARYPQVDVLTLTATPIPRTLHMSMSGIRDISLLEEGPEDRRPVQTYVMEYDSQIVDEAILREIGREGQVFYLYNNTQKLAGIAAGLSERLPGVRVVYAHGQMSERRLEEAVSGFAAGDFDVLVCTTIIESGIDMPNVNTIIVENADRLGLAQLYQIRGRVGRSERQAYAYITYRPDKVLNEDARKRLAAIRDYTELGSGFRIALRDLEVRGAGNLLGGEQSGHLDAIGYDLYCRMLDETMKELKGEEKETAAADCVIDLKIDAMIPGTYIEDEGQRMEIYRRALHIQNGADWSDLMDEIIDRYGEPPRPLVQMLDIALARAGASACGIEKIEARGKDLYFWLADGAAANENLLRLLQNERYSGKILFHAGIKAHLQLKNGAENEQHVTEHLRFIFN